MKILYKYRPIDIYTIRTLSLNEIYFSSPYDFNDPFDCQIAFPISGDDDDLVNFFHSFSKDLDLDFPREMFVSFVDLLKSGENYDFILETANEILKSRYIEELNNIGIYCLTEINDNMLMYSHYADGHKGVCIEYSIPESSEIFNELHPVTYHDKYPEINHFERDYNKVFKARYTTKAINWEYEKEWRIIKPKFKKRTLALPDNYITGVIFGCNVCKEDKKLLENIINMKGKIIKIYNAEKKKNAFSLTIK